MEACHDTTSGHLITIMVEHSDMDEHKVEWAKRAAKWAKGIPLVRSLVFYSLKVDAKNGTRPHRIK
jgi:hypothetical protein